MVSSSIVHSVLAVNHTPAYLAVNHTSVSIFKVIVEGK